MAIRLFTHFTNLRLGHASSIRRFPSLNILSFICWALLLVLSCSAQAAPEVDNNLGTWTDSLNDELGTLSLNNVSNDPFAGTASLDSGQASGSQTTVVISPPSFDGWEKVCIDASYGAVADLDVTLLDPNNGDAPIAGFVDMDMSNLDAEGCIDISALDVASFPEIRVRVDHTRGATAPTVRELKVTWNPQTVLLFDKKTLETIPAGVQFPYQVRLSANFVNAQNVIVWDTLPMNGRGITYPTDYGQADEPIIGQISDGGIFTADGLTDAATGDPLPSFPDGMTEFPEDTVVWYFDEIEAGNSLVLQLFVEAPNGTLNGTVYENNANVHVDNGEDKVAPPVETIITSEPKPNLTKAGATLASPGVTRVFGLGGENYVIARNSPAASDTLTFRIRDPFGPVDGNDYDEENRSRMYNTVIYDDLSGLVDPNGDGDTSDSYLLNPTNPAHTISATKFNADGTTTTIPATFTATAITVHTTDVPAQSVYWDFGTLEVGDGYQIEFKVDLASDIPQLTEFTNTAGLDSDQTELLTDSLPMIVDVPIGGCFCKFGYFPHYLPKEQDVPCGLDIDGVVPVVAGDPVQYRLYNTNCGVIELNDIVYFDRIPADVDFVSAALHNRQTKEDITAAEGATVWYYTGAGFADPEVHPPFDWSVLPGGSPADWSTTRPATVTWVAVHHPSMPSFIDFPNDPGSRVFAAFNTTVKTPADPCAEFWIENWGLVDVYRKTDGTLQTLADPFEYKNDDLTRVRPPQGEFFVDSDSASVTPVTVIPGVADYSLTVRNESAESGLVGLESFTDVEVELQLTQVNVNGVPTYPSIQGVSGGIITDFDPVNGTVTLQLGRQLAPGEESTIDMELGFPNGTENLSTYTVSANLTGFDDLCSPFEATIQTSGVVSGTPLLQTNKDDVLNVIGSGDDVTYEVNYRNVGTATSVNTWVADRIPFRTTFSSATAPNGEEVWFTDKLPPSMPANQISVLDPIDFSVISANFSPGIHDDNGTPGNFSDDTWTSPFGDQTTWIAYKVDNPSLSPPQLEVSPNYSTVTFTVTNDDDGTGAGTAGSPEGTVLFNELVIFSDTNLQAVGNEVRTTIEAFPGLQISKTSNKDLVTATESFRWHVDYINNSGFTDDVVTITDTLPKDVTLKRVLHEWNDAAVGNGQPAGEINITSDPNVTITNNADGTTTVEILIAGSPAMKSDLLTGEGGRLVFRVAPLSSTASGTETINEVRGFASNPRSSVVVSDSDPVTIANPDLTVSKIVSNAEPQNGDRLTFTLLVANRGLNSASDVTITDTLPAGMTFVEGSTQMLTPGYSIADDPSGGDSTLVWTSLTQDGGAAGELPGQSVDVYISYQVDVAGTAGDALTNTAEVSTSDPEDPAYPNTDEQEVVLPFPDPKIAKSAASVSQAGETVMWTITYSNAANNSAPDVYIIDTIPAGLTFETVVLPSGVTAYYTDAGAAPTFTPGTSGAGWSSTPPAGVTFIAFEIGTLPANQGDTKILVGTSIPAAAPPGSSYTNSATIATSATENDDPEDPTDGAENNAASATTKIPGVDMAVAKSASVEGSVPGLRPGDPITYTIEVTNTGTETAYGVKVEDTLPANFDPHPTAFNGFATVEVFDDQGAAMNLEDTGGAPITVPISATLDNASPSGGDTVTWHLGTTANDADPDYYRNVGVPVGGIVTFTFQGYVNAAAADGDDVFNSTTLIVDNQEDSDPAEEFLANNTDDVSTKIYRPEVSVGKSVVNDSDGDETWTEAGETLTYTIEYNNTGNADADDVVISEIIPAGTSYVPGSLQLPAGAGVVWSPNAADPESFEVQFENLPAPATFDGNPGYGTGTENDPFTDLLALGGVPTGTYWFRIGGLSFQGYVDGETEGGGWLMILNYVHEGGTNPELDVRTTDLPLLNSDTLGDDESGSESWGHAGNAMAALLDFDTMYFHGRTSGHTRIMNIRTTAFYERGTSYVQTGTGSFNNMHFDGNWIAVPGHTATIPATATGEQSDNGDFALTEFPFYEGNTAYWAIRAGGNRWELDDFPDDESNDTIHRVFVRKEPIGSAGAVLCLEPPRKVEVESFLSEISALDAGYDQHVAFDFDGDNDPATDDPLHTRSQQVTYHAIGDLNGDDIIDYAAGSPYRDLDEANETDLVNVNFGAVLIHLMNADGTIGTIVELAQGSTAANGLLADIEANDLFGYALEPIGDADGDGVPDLAVGAHGNNELGGGAARGAVYLLFLNSDGTLKDSKKIESGVAGLVTANGLTAADDQNSAGIGRGLAYIEDFAGTGNSVLVAGDASLDGNVINGGGYYFLFLERDGSGHLTGNVTSFIKMQSDRDALLTPFLDESDLFGHDLDFIGDIDGNGAEDLVVGAPADDEGDINEGSVYIVLLETTGELKAVNKISPLTSPALPLDPSDDLGYGVAAVGDLDGDGLSEIAASAANDDDSSLSNGNGSNRGATYIIYPNADGTMREYCKLSPIEGNGYLFRQGQNGGQRMNAYDLDGDGIQELFYGSQINIGATYNAPGGGTQTTNPTYAYDGMGGATPTFAASVTSGSDSGWPGVVVAKLNSGSGVYETSVSEDFPVSVDGTLTSWDKLLVNVETDDAVTVTFELRDSGDTTSLFGPVELEDGFADISSIATSNTDMILRVTMTSTDETATACLKSWRATYLVEEVPSFTFQVTVDDPAPAGQSTVDNTVSIATSTPEIDDNTANNIAADSINIRLTDLLVSKSVDKGAVKETDGETISYTVSWEVLGPQGAINAEVTDILPASTSYVTADGAPAVDSDYQGSGLTALVWSLGDQSVGASGSFTVTVTESGAAAGDSLTNVVSISNDRQETDYTNNDDSAITVVTGAAGLANVWIEKDTTTPVVDLYGGGSFTINYGNNGNGDATNVVISDTLPDGLTFVSATPGTAAGNGFTYNAGTLAPGATGSITVAFNVDQTYMTANWGETQVNIASIATDSPETDLSDNSDPAEVDVILEQLASLSGKVYHDDDRTDGDAGADNLGNLDLGEAGIPGVTITLTGTDIFGNPVNLTTVTDENGDYSFAGINPGTYDVTETQPTGWLSTSTDQGDIIDTTVSPSGTTADQGTAGSDTITGITLAGGERGVDFNFGEDLATLGDTVWIDGDGDGVQDSGEAGVPGVTVRVYTAAGELAGTTTTDINGNYLFDDLLAGDYYVEFDLDTLPFGHSATEQDAGGDDTADSDADPVTGRTQTVTLAAGATDLDLDLGIVGPPVGSIGNYVWFDEDSNGYQDDGERGIANVIVQLKDADGNVVATTVTDADGGYLFTGLEAGQYHVDIDETSLPAGMTQSPLTNAGGDFGNQDHSTGFGYPVTLGGTEPLDNTTADFGYNVNPAGDVNNPSGSPVAALGDYVWIDSDGDGVQDPGETPVAGAELTLYSDHDGDGVYDNVVGTATTDATGHYMFDGLTPDAYVVAVTDSSSASHDILGADYSATGDPDHFGTSGASDNISTPIVLAPGDVILNGDFGYQPKGSAPVGSIGDTVWLDLDGDGSEDAGEPGVPGVSVSLIDDLDGNGEWDPGEPVISTTTTASDGSYLFDDLPYGDYIVWVNDSDGALAGTTQTYDSDGTALTPNQSATTIDAGSPDDTDQDFGYTPGAPLGSIGDTVWGDLDSSGGDQSTQSNEPGLAGVTVNLYASDGTTLIATTVTDSNGDYLFDGLAFDDYVVEVDTATLPAGYSATPTFDSDGDGGAGFDNTSAVTLTSAQPDNRTQDFSFPPDGTRGAIGDTIWADDDSDGTQNGGEQGIPGVTVELWTQGGTKPPKLIATTVTDGNGEYLFDGLPFRDYVIKVDTDTLPAGYDPAPSGDPESDGDNDSNVTISAGTPTDLDQDFGYPPSDTPVGSIGDTIYADLDSDGTQGSDEPGIPGVTVTLTDDQGNSWTTVTDENGNYNFPGLDPDPTVTYTVTVDASTLPPEFDTTPTDDPEDDGDVTSTVNLDVTDPSTRNNDAQDFGFAPATEFGSIGDYVWLDSDGAGDQNETGTGIPGVLVELYDENGELIATTTTGTDGGYLFGGLPLDDGTGAPGADYTVKVADSNFDPGGALQDMDNTADSDADNDSEGELVTLTGAAPVDLDQDFGYVSADDGSIGTTVWNDIDNDGILDPGESGIEGVTVALYRDTDGDGIVDPGEPQVGTTTTDGSGEYLFDGLPFDDYIVVVTDEDSVLDGTWHSVGPNPGTDGNSQEDSGYPVTINSGNPDDDTADFGYYVDPAAVGNYVWFDTDADGVQDAGEPGIEGAVVTMTITYPDGTEIELVDVTDATGHYDFGNLLLDEDYNTGGGGAQPTYELTVQTPVDTEPTVINSGDATALTDSNDPAGTLAIPIQGSNNTALASTDSTASYDFGFTSTLVALGSTIWLEDGIPNGTFDAGEGEAGVPVELYFAGQTPGVDTPVAATITAADGAYLFDNLQPGDYFIYIPASAFNGGPLTGTSSIHGGSVDDNIDGDDDGLDTPENGGYRSNVVNLDTGAEVTGEPSQVDYTGILLDDSVNMTVDLGFTPVIGEVAIGSTIWIDGSGSGNADGSFDDPSEGIGGVAVELYETGQTPGVDPPLRVTTTGPNGDYYFDELPEGDYIVHVPADEFANGPLAGTTSIGGAGGDDGTDNDDNGLDTPVNGGISSAPITLSAGDEPTTGDDDSDYSGVLSDDAVDSTVDFGFQAATGEVALGSRIWTDDDQNGVFDVGEGADGVPVQLYSDPNGDGDFGDGVLVATTATSADGRYLFDQLPSGNYVVHIPADAFAYGPLASATSLTGVDGSDLDEEAAGNDNGTDTPVNGGTSSGPISLSVGGEPQAESSQSDYGGTLPDHSVNMTIDFGFDPAEPDPAIGNAVFFDDDGDGVMDPGEGVNGVVVELYTTDQEPGVDSPFRRTTTTADGNYLFDLLPEDDYLVYIPAENFAPGSPLYQTESLPGAGGDDTNDDDVDENGLDQLLNGGVVSAVIIIRDGGEPINESGSSTGPTSVLADDRVNFTVDFGFQQQPPLGAIGNYVWVDENSDGLQDAGEPGIANVLVQLKDQDGNVIATTLTDNQGGYLFNALPGGDYFIDIDESSLPTGMSQTTPGLTPGTDFGNQDHSGDGYAVTVGGEEPWENTTGDFGYNYNPDTDVNDGTNTAALGDRLWIDSDGDGIQDPDEIGVKGAEVTLIAAGPDGLFGTGDDDTSITTTTDANGNYFFDGLAPGAYQVEVTDSNSASHNILSTDDYAQTGDPDHFAETDPAPSANDHLTTTPVVLGPGDVFLQADFGYRPIKAGDLGSIGDTVWMDADGDGVLDVDESGIPGVTVALIQDINENGVFDAGDLIIASDTTDENGNYLFDDLPVDDGDGDADYLVWVNDTDNVLSGTIQTYDSNGALSSPNVSAVALTAASPDNNTQDFGYTPGTPPGSIGDYVWLDADSDGIQDEPAAGLGKVVMELLDATGTVVATATTSSDGYYLFEGLPVDDNTGAAGADYTVRVASENFDPGGTLEGYTNTSDPDSGTTSPDNSGTAITLTAAAPHNRVQDFGYVTTALGSIGDTVWFDADDSGTATQDPSEPGIPCVLVSLYADTDGDGIFEPGTDDMLIGQQYTDSQGNYLFTDLPLDVTYFTEVDTDSLPGFVDPASSYEETGGGETTAGNNVSDATPTAVSPHVTDQDFSYAPFPAATELGFIGDHVWFDADSSGGDQSTASGESGLQGVVVILKDHTGTEIARTTTDSSGYYVFLGLPLDDGTGAPGADYTVEVLTSTLTHNVSRTSTHDGSDGGSDSTSVTTLTAGAPVDLDQDFSYPPATALGSIGDYVWLDSDGAGDQNETGTGIEGVIVELLDTNGNVVVSTETDENGYYLFPGLPLNETYQVQVAPENFAPGAVLEGMTNTFDSDSPGDSVGADVTLTSGSSTDLGQDFGYVGAGSGSIGTTVWNDIDADGMLEAGEPGIPGVTVALYRDLDGNGQLDPGEPLIGTTTTDGNGDYLFEGLPFDDYIVDVTDEDGVLGGFWHSDGPNDGSDGNSQNDAYAVTINSGSANDNTADFGYYKDLAALGNYVWEDTDADGQQDAGEPGIEGAIVTLEITYPDTTVVTLNTTTDANGHYSFGNLLGDEDYNGGGVGEPSYEISVASPSRYTPTLVDQSAGGITDLDDSDNHDGVSASPEQGLTDVAENADPTLEETIASYDFGFIKGKANTWADFLGDNGLSGNDALPQPTGALPEAGNPDKDIYDNLLEYAFCLDPNDPIPAFPPFCAEVNTSGDPDTFEAAFYRPAGGLTDVTYCLEGRTTLPTTGDTTWVQLTVVPGSGGPGAGVTVTDLGNGLEEVRIADITTVATTGDTLLGFEDALARGFVRLTVKLDTDGGGTDFTSHTQVQGWQQTDFGQNQCATFSYPWMQKEAFSGAVASVSGQELTVTGTPDLSTALNAGTSYFLEILSGDNEGHRFDIVSADASGVITLAPDNDLCAGPPFNTSTTLPANLAEDRFVVRAHQTVEGLFPAAALTPEADPSLADRLLIYEGGAIPWKVLYVDDPAEWKNEGSGANAGDDVLPPCQGYFVHPKLGTLTVLGMGVVRANDFHCPLGDGYRMVANGYPIDTSFTDRGLDDTVNQVTGSLDPATADQVHIWDGDGSVYSESFTGHFRLEGSIPSLPPFAQWSDVEDVNLDDTSDEKVFKADRSVFYHRIATGCDADHQQPLPWAP